MKHNLSIVRKLKLDHYEIRVLVDALNAKRLKQKESGIDTIMTASINKWGNTCVTFSLYFS